MIELHKILEQVKNKITNLNDIEKANLGKISLIDKIHKNEFKNSDELLDYLFSIIDKYGIKISLIDLGRQFWFFVEYTPNHHKEDYDTAVKVAKQKKLPNFLIKSHVKCIMFGSSEDEHEEITLDNIFKEKNVKIKFVWQDISSPENIIKQIQHKNFIYKLETTGGSEGMTWGALFIIV